MLPNTLENAIRNLNETAVYFYESYLYIIFNYNKCGNKINSRAKFILNW